MSTKMDIQWYWIPSKSTPALLQLRALTGLEIAPSEDGHWVREAAGTFDLSLAERLRTLPGALVYTLRDEQLYLLNHLLPACRAPHLLWSPISRMLSVRLPLAVQTELLEPVALTIKLVADQSERNAAAQLVDRELLSAYAKTAPLVRLEPLVFCFVETDRAIVKGTPLLSLPGQGFWQIKNELLPLGYTFEYPKVIELLPAEQLRVWQMNGEYFTVADRYWTPLRRDNCVRRTIAK
ncbi:MAG: hypothetical protein AB8F78_09230 [Saprospiraceae bacterium]